LNDWIGEVLRWRQTDGNNSENAIRLGLREVAAGGAILAGEIATPPWLVANEPLDVEVVAFAEVLGLTEQRAAERLAAAASLIESLADRPWVTAGVSPHAPYSTSLETTRRAVSIAESRCLGVAMHLGESEAERELLTRGTGGFAKTLATLGVDYAAIAGPGEGRHMAYLRILANAPFALVIHGHDLQEDEVDVIATSPRMTLVYCPRTQAYFGHKPYGFERLVRRGGRIALGTDSRASNPDLSIWNELRWLWKNRPDLPWDRVLRMATIDGADAFLRPDLGRIETGARCGLLALPGDADSVDELVELWLGCDSPIWITR
jgi:cytosine/adenosine deaminase-related metal-dependent hydrolase